jgi:hypothetical protein
MRMRARRRLGAVVIAASLCGGAAPFGCSLGLDPSLIGRDASAEDATSGDGSLSEAMSGDATPPPKDAKPTDGPAPGDGGACSTDADCAGVAADAGTCVTSAKCDPTWHVCLLDVCGAAACQVELCETNKCSLPATYSFAPTSFTVTYGGVPGYGPTYDISAAWPFLFVDTTNGVIAYNVVDPTSSSPPVVAVEGIPFIPNATIAVGRRVYFMTGVQGSGPAFGQPIAWIDVPQNPFVTTLQASSAWLSTTENPVNNVLTNGTNGLFMVYGTTALDPTVNLQPPFAEMGKVTAFPNVSLPAGAGILASSGSRLLSYRYDGTTQFPNFAIINGPGTASAIATAEQAVSAFGPQAQQATFTTGSDGSVLWTTGVLDELDGGGSDGIATATLTWLLPSSTSANFDTADHVDLVSYSPAANTYVTGPPVWIDANTVLGLAAPSGSSSNSTLVQVATKSPRALTAGRSTTLPVGPGSVGVASSNGFAYALVGDDPMNLTCTIYILAPSCGGTAADASAE